MYADDLGGYIYYDDDEIYPKKWEPNKKYFLEMFFPYMSKRFGEFFLVSILFLISPFVLYFFFGELLPSNVLTFSIVFLVGFCHFFFWILYSLPDGVINANGFKNKSRFILRMLGNVNNYELCFAPIEPNMFQEGFTRRIFVIPMEYIRGFIPRSKLESDYYPTLQREREYIARVCTDNLVHNHFCTQMQRSYIEEQVLESITGMIIFENESDHIIYKLTYC